MHVYVHCYDCWDFEEHVVSLYHGSDELRGVCVYVYEYVYVYVYVYVYG